MTFLELLPFNINWHFWSRNKYIKRLGRPEIVIKLCSLVENQFIIFYYL